MPLTLDDIARALGAALSGDGARPAVRLMHPADAEGPGDVALAIAGDAFEALPETRAGAVIVKPGTETPAGVAVIAYGGHERMALAILTRLFAPKPTRAAGIHPSAVVDATAKVDASAHIGPQVAVGAGSAIGAGTMVLAGATVGDGVTVGRDCVIHPGARLGDRVAIGDRVVIHPNAVIGADGFSFIPVRNPDGTRNPIDLPAGIASLGTVVIGDDVEIGAGTTIDRGTLRDTRIGRGTKIDNQVQIAHNAVIGEACLICGMVGIAGSAVIGDRTILASGAGVGDHIAVGPDVTVSALAGVIADVPAGQIVDGIPAMPRQQAFERYMNVGRLKMLYPRVDDLRKRVEALEKDGNGG